ncbi:MAG: CBS domain-containing protein [Bacillota bacterium]|uniref:CBS domain-containing protein n=1 Tax=Virgibacillus salarius TaxID=447199 RepID=A0A941I9Q7_9BACI|nr:MULTISPECIES: CBS domain-containing protein [Bacillaceae]NAZ07349.1 CBS domain-containing protein [Agaribacter marinus]MBR7794627.1 CBS domain-containing protein [Virgibacillus salarius]MCC2250919.1 CBS domain-containing protein [Virgibacillus sp. AGTR]MDY7044763.1 CBS domain-containing protein [Virgibacillus sp. M23]QRZ16369.1 CBS domain-containing protein [Virgibacillus sp. AGTR]
MYKNSERFLTAFNRIEKLLRALLIHKKDVGFSKAVKILRNSNALVRTYSDDLLEFAELRNAIVHNKIDMTHAIAEPHDTIVERIEEIEKELSEPKRVIPLFSRSVYCYQLTDPLNKLLTIIHEKQLSKFPVYQGEEFKGLLTQKGITNWLAGRKNQDKLNGSCALEEVLPFENQDNTRFIHQGTTIYEAIEIFKEHTSKGERLEALLITKNGKPSSHLLGIITTWDILEIS